MSRFHIGRVGEPDRRGVWREAVATCSTEASLAEWLRAFPSPQRVVWLEDTVMPTAALLSDRDANMLGTALGLNVGVTVEADIHGVLRVQTVEWARPDGIAFAKVVFVRDWSRVPDHAIGDILLCMSDGPVVASNLRGPVIVGGAGNVGLAVRFLKSLHGLR